MDVAILVVSGVGVVLADDVRAMLRGKLSRYGGRKGSLVQGVGERESVKDLEASKKQPREQDRKFVARRRDAEEKVWIDW